MSTGPSTPTRSRLIAAVLLASVTATGVYLALTRHTDDAGQPATRPPAPNVSLTTLDGSRLELATLHGKVVLIDFWASWCGPCRDEIPSLLQLHRSYAPRSVQVLGISMDDDVATVRKFYDEHQMTYPVAVGDVALAERFGGVLGLPVKFLLDREGRIAFEHRGPVDAAVLTRELDTLLAE